MHGTHFVNQILFSLFTEFILVNSRKENNWELYVNVMKQMMHAAGWFAQYGQIIISAFDYVQIKQILNVKLDFQEKDIKKCLITMEQIKTYNLRWKLCLCCCMWCNTRFVKSINQLKKCKRCKLAYYCSRKCQKQHWKLSHRHQCHLLAQCFNYKKSINVQ